MDEVRQFVENWTGLSPDSQGKILSTLLIILVLTLVRTASRRVIHRRIEDVRIRYTWSRATTYLIAALGIILVARVWFVGVGNILNWLGLVSAGLAIAMHDTVANFAGWAFILWRRPFLVGDRVQIGEHCGDVIDVRLFQFTLLETREWVDADQSTGRILHIPNGKVLREPLANYTKGFRFIWNEIAVLVTFESDWKRAKELMEAIIGKQAEQFSEGAEREIRETARRYMIYYGKLTPIVYLSVRESGVLLTMRYLVNPRHRRGSEQAIWVEILEAFSAESRIDFAYPSTRYFDNRAEGKQALRADGPVPGLPPSGS